VNPPNTDKNSETLNVKHRKDGERSVLEWALKGHRELRDRITDYAREMRELKAMLNTNVGVIEGHLASLPPMSERSQLYREPEGQKKNSDRGTADAGDGDVDIIEMFMFFLE